MRRPKTLCAGAVQAKERRRPDVLQRASQWNFRQTCLAWRVSCPEGRQDRDDQVSFQALADKPRLRSAM